MIFLAGTFLCFEIVVLPGKRHLFLASTLGLGLVAVAALHILNPEGLIARVNLSRFREGKALDSEYLTGLSSDALPIVSPIFPQLPFSAREALLRKFQPSQQQDWQSWNWSRNRGEQIVRKLQ